MATIVTAANERYFPAIRPYLESLARHSQIPARLVCVGEQEMGGAPVPTVRLPRERNHGAPDETESPQHGAWLQVVDGKPEDVVIFTDGDILLQRPFSAREMDWLSAFPPDTVAAGWNSGPDETLEVEAKRLRPKVTMAQLSAVFGDLSLPCYNIGVFVAQRQTFMKIYALYMASWRLACEAFGHAARQQWLVCWAIHRLGLTVQVTPYSLHSNGHYGVPPGCIYADGLLYHGNDIVAFRHKL